MSKKDYYETLGVDKNASQAEIKSAFRKLAKQYHPDICKEENAEASEGGGDEGGGDNTDSGSDTEAGGDAAEAPEQPEEKVAYVGEGKDYATLDEAVQGVEDGTKIVLAAGEYSLSVVIAKSVIIEGPNANLTVAEFKNEEALINVAKDVFAYGARFAIFFLSQATNATVHRATLLPESKINNYNRKDDLT